MDHIQSTKNPRVKEWKKLHTKKYRDQTGLYLIEGFHLVEEAMKVGTIEEVMLLEQLDQPSFLNDVPITTISSDVSRFISDTETPQGIFAVCRKMEKRIDLSSQRRFLLLDAVQDPGNIGTLVRTAEAAGIDAVIFGTGTADLYNPKVIRSAQGSHFHIDTYVDDLASLINRFQTAQIPVYGTALEGAIPFTEVPSTDTYALIVGNEGSGVQPELLARTTKNLYIPIYGKSESLNVAIAAGILLYHLRGE